MRGTHRTTRRDSRIELLRIFAMLLIVACHFTLYMPQDFRGAPGWSGAFAWLVVENGQVGVVLFFLITGYFLAGKAFRPANAIRTWLQTLTYSIGLYIVVVLAACTGRFPAAATQLKGSEGGHTLIATLLPVLSNRYWFVTTYIFVLLISPLLNIALKNVSHRGMSVILVALVASSLLPLLGFHDSLPFRPTLYAVTCYLIGGHLSGCQSDGESGRRTHRLAWLVVVVALCMAVPVAVNRLTLEHAAVAVFLGWGTDPVTELNAFQVVAGTAIFVFTVERSREKSPWHVGIVNLIASGMFGVYLLHDNPLIRHALYEQVLARLADLLQRIAPAILGYALVVIVEFVCIAIAALMIDRLVCRPIQRLAVPRLERAIQRLLTGRDVVTR